MIIMHQTLRWRDEVGLKFLKMDREKALALRRGFVVHVSIMPRYLAFRFKC